MTLMTLPRCSRSPSRRRPSPAGSTTPPWSGPLASCCALSGAIPTVTRWRRRLAAWPTPARVPVDDRRLADPDVPLEELVAGWREAA
jgi:hypothetical protein